MNGVYLHFLTTELKPILAGARIKRILQIGRLIYVDLNIGQIVVSFIPEAMGLYFQEKGSILPKKREAFSK